MDKHPLLTFAEQRTQNQIVLDAVRHSVQYDGGNPSKMTSRKFIYFLTYRNEILYVGSTINLKSRIKEHIKEKEPFDSAYVVSVNGSEFSHVHIEALIISELNPEWNKVKPNVPERFNYSSFESPQIQLGTCVKIQYKGKELKKIKSLGRGLSALLYDNDKISIPIDNLKYELLRKENEVLKQHIEILKEQVAWMMANPQREYIFV
jgi:hypothetical protein